MSILFHSIQNRTKRPLDLHELLVRDETATFFIRIAGNTFEHFGICAGDILVVDRSAIENAHKFYVVVIDGEFTLTERGSIGGESCEYWGAVTYIIHKS